MTTTTEPDEIAEATARVQSAERDRADIEERLIEGDAGVRTADLLAADDEVAQARAALAMAEDVRRRRDERQAEQERERKRKELNELIRTSYGKHEGDILDTFDAAREALAALVAAVAGHNSDLHDLGELLRAAGGCGREIVQQGDSVRLTRQDVTIAPLDAATLCAEAAVRALSAAGAPAGNLAKMSSTTQPGTHERIAYGDLIRDGIVGPTTQLRRLVSKIEERDA